MTGFRLVALALLVVAPVGRAQTARDDELARRMTGPDVVDRHAAADEALGRAALPVDAWVAYVELCLGARAPSSSTFLRATRGLRRLPAARSLPLLVSLLCTPHAPEEDVNGCIVDTRDFAHRAETLDALFEALERDEVPQAEVERVLREALDPLERVRLEALERGAGRADRLDQLALAWQAVEGERDVVRLCAARALGRLSGARTPGLFTTLLGDHEAATLVAVRAAWTIPSARVPGSDLVDLVRRARRWQDVLELLGPAALAAGVRPEPREQPRPARMEVMDLARERWSDDARSALLGLGDDAVPALEAALREGRGRHDALDALKLLAPCSDEAAVTLFAWLDEPGCREAVLEGLARARRLPLTSVGPLRKLLAARDADPRSAALAARALGGAPQAATVLLGALSHGDAEVRRAAAAALARIGPRPAWAEPVGEAFDATEEPELLWLLAGCGPRGVEMLERRAGHADADARLHAARALAAVAPESARACLARLLDDPDRLVASAAAQGLARVGASVPLELRVRLVVEHGLAVDWGDAADAARPLLARAAEAGDGYEVRRRALRALGRTGPRGVDHLLARCGESELAHDLLTSGALSIDVAAVVSASQGATRSRHRERLTRLLAVASRRDPRAAVAALEALARDAALRHDAVAAALEVGAPARRVVAAALEDDLELELSPWLGDDGHLLELALVLVDLTARDTRSEQRWRLRRVLSLLWRRDDVPMHRFAPAIARALDDPDVELRLEAARLLACLGPAATPAVGALRERALTDPDPYVRGAAIEAIASLGPGALHALDALSAGLSHPRAGDAAAEALVALGPLVSSSLRRAAVGRPSR